MRRQACADWPRILNPADGCYPLAAPVRGGERVLHLALYPEHPRQVTLQRALESLCAPGDYVMIDWVRHSGTGLIATAIAAAAQLRPTLVFAQLQRPSAFTAMVARQVRHHCGPGGVLVQWDGDMHHEPEDPERAWFVELGREFDCSLTTDTAFQARYAQLGVRNPGYLAIGVADPYRPTTPAPGTPPVVFTASSHPHMLKEWRGTGYARRFVALARLTARYSERFGLYGNDWGTHPCGRPFVEPAAEAAVYSACACALSISISNAIKRYSSMRLFDALSCGAVTLVDRFPDCDGLGLVHGENCLIWDTYDELEQLIDDVLADPAAPRWQSMRSAAAELGREQTWAARMLELQAILNILRGVA